MGSAFAHPQKKYKLERNQQSRSPPPLRPSSPASPLKDGAHLLPVCFLAQTSSRLSYGRMVISLLGASAKVSGVYMASIWVAGTLKVPGVLRSSRYSTVN